MNNGHRATRPTGTLGIIAAAVAIAVLGGGCDNGYPDVSYYPDNNTNGFGYGYYDSQYSNGGDYYDDGSSNYYDYDDGGIAPGRFDPAPAKGPLTPG